MSARKDGGPTVLVLESQSAAEIDARLCDSILRDELCFHASTGSAVFAEEAEMVLSAFLSPKVWDKHRYSLNDIQRTLEKFPSFHLASLAMKEHMLQSAHRRTTVPTVDRLVAHFEKKPWLYKDDVLCPPVCKQEQRHAPPLPCHGVRRDVWQALAAQTPKREVLQYDEIVFWAQCYYLPLAVEPDGAVIMKRAVPLAVFQSVYPNLREHPPMAHVADAAMVLLEEAFLLYADA